MPYNAEWTHTKRQLLSRKREAWTNKYAEKKNRSTGIESFPLLDQLHTASQWQSYKGRISDPQSKSTSITWTAKGLSSTLWVYTQNSLPNRTDHQLPFAGASVLYCISTGWHRNSKYSSSEISCLFPTCQQKSLFWYLQEWINLVFLIRSQTHPNDTYTHSHGGW